MMSIQERADIAVQMKKNGYNCCEAVTASFADVEGIDAEIMKKVSSGFGAGMGCMEATCGALAGAVMVAGVLQNGSGTVQKSMEILENFEKKSGATICRELKGIGTGKVLCECNDCVRNAVYALAEALNLE